MLDGCLWLTQARTQTDPSSLTRVEEDPWLDGRHVVFGKVIEYAVVRKIETNKTDGRVSLKVKIADCGGEEVAEPLLLKRLTQQNKHSC